MMAARCLFLPGFWLRVTITGSRFTCGRDVGVRGSDKAHTRRHGGDQAYKGQGLRTGAADLGGQGVSLTVEPPLCITQVLVLWWWISQAGELVIFHDCLTG